MSETTAVMHSVLVSEAELNVIFAALRVLESHNKMRTVREITDHFDIDHASLSGTIDPLCERLNLPNMGGDTCASGYSWLIEPGDSQNTGAKVAISSYDLDLVLCGLRLLSAHWVEFWAKVPELQRIGDNVSSRSEDIRNLCNRLTA